MPYSRGASILNILPSADTRPVLRDVAMNEVLPLLIVGCRTEMPNRYQNAYTQCMDKLIREEAYLVVQETNIGGGSRQIFKSRQEAEEAAVRMLDNEYAVLIIPVTRFSTIAPEPIQ